MPQLLLQSLLGLARQLGAVLWLLVLTAAALLLAANTELGQRLLAWGVGELTGGQVVLQGLSGTLPAAPRLQRIELRDGEGIWLVIEEAALDLDLPALLRGEVAVGRLSARAVSLHRLPEGRGEGATPLRLPFRIRLDQVSVDELGLDPAFPGAPPLRVEAEGAAGGSGPLRLGVQAGSPGRPDRYRLDLQRIAQDLQLELRIQEDPGGLLPAIAGPLGWPLPPDLGAWRLSVRAEGPESELNLAATLESGALRAGAEGVLDLANRSALRLRLGAQAPSLVLESHGDPSLGWTALALTSDLRGPWDAPEGEARLEVLGLARGDLGLERLTLTATGDRQGLGLVGTLEGLLAPFPLPESARRDPLQVSGQVGLQGPRPFSLDLAHPLLALRARGEIQPPSAQASLDLPDLASLADLAGLDLAGTLHLDITADLEGDPSLEASGDIALTQAPEPLPRLLGPKARLALVGRLEGDAWRLDSARLDGAGIGIEAQGSAGPSGIALGWALDLPSLGAVAAGWSGGLRAQGGVLGPVDSLNLVADLHAQGAHDRLGAGVIQGRLEARLAGPAAALTLGGDWAGRPLRLELGAQRGPNGDLRLDLGAARWAGVTASGDLALAAGATWPQGELHLVADRFSDLNALPFLAGLGPELGLDGRLNARLRLEGEGARIDALGEALSLPGPARIGALAMDAELRDPWGDATLRGQLRLAGLSFAAATGDLTLTAEGRPRDLGWTAEAALGTGLGPTRLGLDGRLDAGARRLTVQRLEAQALDETLRLLGPAQVDLSQGIGVDRLRLGLGSGTIELAGRLTPALALEARLVDLPLEPVARLTRRPPLTGTLGGEARLTGTLAAPVGPVRLQARDLRLTQGPGRGLPPAEIELALQIGPTDTRVEASARAGTATRLGLRGTLVGPSPLRADTLDLRADGRLDLALLDPLLTPAGRQMAGQAALDARVTGPLRAPRLAGTVRLTQGALWDRTIGLVLTQAQGSLILAGDEVRLEGLTAQAGPGRLALTGTVGALAPMIPVDLRLQATDASPLQLDRLRLQGSGDLRLTGQALGRLEAAGRLRLDQVKIQLPERLPAQVARLEVREVGERRAGALQAPAGPGWRPDLGLDLLISAPRSVQVSGRGVEAELGGEVRLGGTLEAPALSGGFNLLRGEYDLVGQTLRFSRGRLGFDGAAGLNPSLDLEARVTAAGSTAILAVEGTAQAPRIALRGEPEMPEDEVLSRLLFGVAGGRLSPWQATRLGLAAASLAGIEVEGLGLLGRVREGLGLGVLRLGGDAQGQPQVEGGRQLSERVYLGARQGSRAGEPQGVLRIDVAPRIQLEADLGPTGGTRAGAGFEIEY